MQSTTQYHLGDTLTAPPNIWVPRPYLWDTPHKNETSVLCSQKPHIFVTHLHTEVKSLVLNKSPYCDLATGETVETGRLSPNKMAIRKQTLGLHPSYLLLYFSTLSSKLLGAVALTDPQSMSEDSCRGGTAPSPHKLTWGTCLAINEQVDARGAGTAETAWIWGPETQMAAATILHSTWRCHCTGRELSVGRARA